MIDTSMHFRRMKILLATPEIFVECLKNEKPVTLSFDGMPRDARVVATRINPDSRLIEIILESESFPVVRPGWHMEYFTVNITRHYTAPVAETHPSA